MVVFQDVKRPANQLISSLLRMSKNDGLATAHPICQGISTCYRASTDVDLPDSDAGSRWYASAWEKKIWPQAFHRRHPGLEAVQVKALEWERRDHRIYDKVVDWFAVIRNELASLVILAENAYNVDEIGVLLSVLHSPRVRVSKYELAV